MAQRMLQQLVRFIAPRPADAIHFGHPENAPSFSTEDEENCASPMSELSQPHNSPEGEAYLPANKSIYQVPNFHKKYHVEAYHPAVIAFGPYHHGRGDHLKHMEDKKKKAYKDHLKHMKAEGIAVQDYVNILVKEVDKLMEFYEQLDEKWRVDQKRFLKLMVVDGCFMLELLKTSGGRNPQDVQTCNIYGEDMSMVMPLIKKDMVMIENQIPLLVLQRLLEVQTGIQQDSKGINRLILDFVAPHLSTEDMDGGLHVLDVVRTRLLLHGTALRPLGGGNGSGKVDYSATEVLDAKIKINITKLVDPGYSLKNITLEAEKRVLVLPQILIDQNFETMFLNLLAFELIHCISGYYLNSYVYLMKSLIKSENDVRVLQSEDVISNEVGSEMEVARIFDMLGKFARIDKTGTAYNVRQRLNYNCSELNKKREQRIYKYWSHLRKNQFKNPITIFGVIAGIILLIAACLSAGLAAATYIKNF